MPSLEAELITFNNTAVDFVEAGHLEVACELFKAALEIVIAREKDRHKLPTGQLHSDQHIIPRAEGYLQTLDFCVQSNSCSDRRSRADDSCILPFLLYDKAFRIAESPSEEPLSIDTEYRKHPAIILFNLALVSQLYNPSSLDAIRLYNLVSCVLEGKHASMLGIALINNVGAWYADNGNFVGASRCMDRLVHLILQRTGSQVGNPAQDGFLSNVMWLFATPSFASPAA